MKTIRIAALVAAAALAALVAGGAVAGGPPGTSFAPELSFVDDQVLVGYEPGTSAQERNQIEGEVNAQDEQTVGAATHVLNVGQGNVAKAIAALERHGAVRYAQPNYVHHVDMAPNDPSFGQLWGLLNSGQTVNGTAGTAGADIKATQAWDLSTGSKNVVVGIVDTGIDYNHPDLAANAWSNPGGIGGCAAGTHGYNAIAKTCNPLDDHNHGTHVSGTIGGVGNNGVGITGVNWNVSLMGLKFLNAAGSGTTANAIAAIDWAINAKIAGVNVRVLSNSWGGGPFEQALLDVINKAGANDILFVAAAGNSSANNDSTPHYPSSYGAANEIAVAATTQTDGLASFSNYGATSVNLGAPGTNIYSSVRGGLYAFFNGTSMATPHVSGAAALLLSACSLTTAALKSTLLSNVDTLGSLAGKTTTGGRLNVSRALSSCAAPSAPDYSLAVTPASRTVAQTDSTTYTTTVNRIGGFADPVTLSVVGLPGNATASFLPNPADASDASSTLTVTTSGDAAGTYPLTISGTAGTSTRTATATLVVSPPGDFSLAASPTSRNVKHGRATTYTIAASALNGFTGSVSLSVSGLPAGATASFTPNPVAAGGSSTLSVATASSSAKGTYTLTVRGTSGSLVHAVTVTLRVT